MSISHILKLLDKLPELLIEPERPSLLHGDLWSGNYIVGSDGQTQQLEDAGGGSAGEDRKDKSIRSVQDWKDPYRTGQIPSKDHLHDQTVGNAKEALI